MRKWKCFLTSTKRLTIRSSKKEDVFSLKRLSTHFLIGIYELGLTTKPLKFSLLKKNNRERHFFYNS